ncbi:MAG: hypothetical protein ACRDNK_09480 [Solirubrobacteraceae bacterium]
MLHAAGLKTGGRLFAFVTNDDLVVKLPTTRVAELIASGTGRLCDPRGGRPMKELVRLQPDDEQCCHAYRTEGVNHLDPPAAST